MEELINTKSEPKGEYVILIEGNKEIKTEKLILNELSLESHYEYYESKGLNKKEIIKKIANDREMSKNEIYQYFIQK